MTLAGQEFFLQRATDDEDGRHDHAADEEGMRQPHSLICTGESHWLTR
jgi:hypothetical protein